MIPPSRHLLLQAIVEFCRLAVWPSNDQARKPSFVFSSAPLPCSFISSQNGDRHGKASQNYVLNDQAQLIGTERYGLEALNPYCRNGNSSSSEELRIMALSP